MVPGKPGPGPAGLGAVRLGRLPRLFRFLRFWALPTVQVLCGGQCVNGVKTQGALSRPVGMRRLVILLSAGRSGNS